MNLRPARLGSLLATAATCALLALPAGTASATPPTPAPSSPSQLCAPATVALPSATPKRIASKARQAACTAVNLVANGYNPLPDVSASSILSKSTYQAINSAWSVTKNRIWFSLTAGEKTRLSKAVKVPVAGYVAKYVAVKTFNAPSSTFAPASSTVASVSSSKAGLTIGFTLAGNNPTTNTAAAHTYTALLERRAGGWKVDTLTLQQ